jgi:hypothetical protein
MAKRVCLLMLGLSFACPGRPDPTGNVPNASRAPSEQRQTTTSSNTDADQASPPDPQEQPRDAFIAVLDADLSMRRGAEDYGVEDLSMLSLPMRGAWERVRQVAERMALPTEGVSKVLDLCERGFADSKAAIGCFQEAMPAARAFRAAAAEKAGPAADRECVAANDDAYYEFGLVEIALERQASEALRKSTGEELGPEESASERLQRVRFEELSELDGLASQVTVSLLRNDRQGRLDALATMERLGKLARGRAKIPSVATEAARALSTACALPANGGADARCHVEVHDLDPPLRVRAGPSTEAPVLAELSNGTRLVVEESRGPWDRIGTPAAGWLWRLNTEWVCE